jgi:hypothetical protein
LLVALALFAAVVLLAFDLVGARFDEDLAGARLTLFFMLLFLHTDEPIAGPNINGPGASKFHLHTGASARLCHSSTVPIHGRYIDATFGKAAYAQKHERR